MILKMLDKHREAGPVRKITPPTGSEPACLAAIATSMLRRFEKEYSKYSEHSELKYLSKMSGSTRGRKLKDSEAKKVIAILRVKK